MTEHTERERTPLPRERGLNGNAKLIAAVVAALIGSGGGTAWLMAPDAKNEATIEKLRDEIDDRKEARLLSVETENKQQGVDIVELKAMTKAIDANVRTVLQEIGVPRGRIARPEEQ